MLVLWPVSDSRVRSDALCLFKTLVDDYKVRRNTIIVL